MILYVTACFSLNHFCLHSHDAPRAEEIERSLRLYADSPHRSSNLIVEFLCNNFVVFFRVGLDWYPVTVIATAISRSSTLHPIPSSGPQFHTSLPIAPLLPSSLSPFPVSPSRLLLSLPTHPTPVDPSSAIAVGGGVGASWCLQNEGTVNGMSADPKIKSPKTLRPYKKARTPDPPCVTCFSVPASLISSFVAPNRPGSENS